MSIARRPSEATPKRPVSLRNRISLVLAGAVAVALISANLTVFAFASRGLDQRFDEQIYGLSNFAQGVAMAMATGESVPQVSTFPAQQPPGFQRFDSADGGYIGVVTKDGKRPLNVFVLTDPTGKEPPVMPAGLSVPPDGRLMFDTTGVVNGQVVPYRALALGHPTGIMIVTALQTTDLANDRRSLVLVEALATLTVLAVLALLTRWLVGLSLRPLADMEDAAERIAHGDLSQRVEPSGPETEISRLGSALNHMLTEIEEAFAEKEESELRLQASESKLRRFAADASHELRSPLTSIRGYAHLLGRGGIDEAAAHAEAIGRIEQEATRLGTLVDNLLVLTRLDEHATMSAEPVDLNQIVGAIVDDARVVEAARDISFRADDHVVLLADPDAITRITTNLVANACRHTPPGTPIEIVVRGRVAPSEAVSASSDEGDGDHDVEIDVIDHGRGVPADKRDLIFDRFMRIDESRSRDSGGAGLGLAIVASLVSMFDGRCEVHDTPGGGAMFRVVLPSSMALSTTARTGSSTSA